MRDVIQKIIATENEGKTLVERARAEADRILSDARKEGQDIIERARRGARAETEKIVEAAVEEAEREKKNRLAHAAAEIESEIQLDRNASQQAAEGVVRCVCGLQ